MTYSTATKGGSQPVLEEVLLVTGWALSSRHLYKEVQWGEGKYSVPKPSLHHIRPLPMSPSLQLPKTISASTNIFDLRMYQPFHSEFLLFAKPIDPQGCHSSHRLSLLQLPTQVYCSHCNSFSHTNANIPIWEHSLLVIYTKKSQIWILHSVGTEEMVNGWILVRRLHINSGSAYGLCTERPRDPFRCRRYC